VLFVSHRLAEVIEVSDRIAVLRNGRLLATVESAATSPPELVELMLGREVGALERQSAAPRTGEVAIAAEGVSGRVISDLSFAAREGEIVGVTGLTGMGQDELPYLLTGGEPLRAGRVLVHGTSMERPTLQAIREHGVVLVPANRARDAVWMEGSALENLRLPLTRPAQRIRHHAEPAQAAAVMERFGVTPPAPDRLLQTFSGGNQQKIVLGKWLQSRPRVLLLHEPTIGVDAGARHDILTLVRAAADDGNCVLVFSTDYEQLGEVCHRVLVLNYGRLTASLEGARVTETSILNAANAG
jgi:ribose transport system ATP-binding protein